MLKSRNILGALAAALLALLLVAACGGDGGSVATNTPTRSASGTVNPGTTPASGGGGKTEAYTKEEVTFIPPSQFGQLLVPLKIGDTLKVSVKVRSSVVGAGDTQGQNRGDAGIIMAINDPLGSQLLLTGQDIEHTQEITADVEGEHVMAFQNSFPLAAMIVTTKYSVNQ
ncbi:MAG: hypothetical protein FJ320_03850 [SAR202 cluster bacterium]|nr:hypothetical protein [SAR202 cluster bacterium]